MSYDWSNDIEGMHDQYGFHDKIEKLDASQLKAFLQFRIDFLQEELDEMKTAETAEDVVDALIDLCVVAIGTLDGFNVNAHVAWNAVLAANLAKEVGIKPERPNPLGLPDLIKPAGWVAPSHIGNHGRLVEILPSTKCEV